MSEGAIETEVKFRVADVGVLRGDLIARGAILAQSRHLERNTVFDAAGGSLRRRGMLLRLRDALDTHLTLKTPVPGDRHTGQHKARVEHEIVVSDHDAAYAVLTALGFRPWWRYEKYRESFRLHQAIVSLDHTPIGDFVEIEAPPESIRPLAEQLGFDWSARILQTYRELFDESGPADRSDMVF
jgi:adenylate cyclase class 2